MALALGATLVLGPNRSLAGAQAWPQDSGVALCIAKAKRTKFLGIVQRNKLPFRARSVVIRGAITLPFRSQASFSLFLALLDRSLRAIRSRRGFAISH